MAGEFQFEMVFTADTSAVKPATEAVKSELSSVGNAADQTTGSLGKHTAALERDAAAAKKTADASRQLAQAEREARDQLSRAASAPPPASPQSAPVISPLRQPSAPVQEPVQRPSSPGSSPQDLEKLKTSYLPLYSAQRNYQTALTDLDTLQKANAISAQDHAFALAKAQKTFDQETESAKRAATALLGHSSAVKLSSFEMKNLSYQANDTVQSLALGMPTMQVLMQQGPQAVQAVGGVGNALRLVGQVATGANIALGGTAAILVGGAAAWSSYLNSIKPVEIAASGLGRAVAGTAGDMERSAQAGASTAGITVKAARSMEAQFLSTGRIGSENFTKLIGVSKDFATTIGVNSDQAGAALAQLFGDPAKAAQTLYHQYGLIDGATAEYATRLANQNRVSEAQNVILDALPERLARATQATTLLGRAWEGVSHGASNAYDWIGRNIDAAVNGPTLEEQVSQAQAKYQKLLKAQEERPWFNRPGDGQVSRAREAVNTLGPQLRRQQEQAALARARAQAQQDGANSVYIAQQSPANAELQQRQGLGDSLEALRKGASAPGLSADQQNQINEAIKAKTTLLGNLADKQARLNEISRLEVQIQAARDPATRAELTYRQQILQLGLQEINQANAEAQAQRARNEIILAAVSSSGAQAADMRSELEIRQRLNAQVVAGNMTADQAQAKLQEELQLRPLVAAADKAEGETKRQLIEVVKELRSAYGGLAAEQERMATIGIARQSPANAPLEQRRLLQQDIDRLKADIARGGQSDPQVTAEQNAALAEKQRLLVALGDKQQILNQIDELGIKIQNETNPLIQAELTARQKRLQLSLQETNSAEAEAEALRARNLVINAVIASSARQAGDMQAEIGFRRQLNTLVAAGTLTSDDAQRKLQEELQLRPLIAAAAMAEGAEKQRLLKVISDLRVGYEGLTAAEKEASANDYIRSQQDKLETLRAQQSVVGQSEATQARVNALVQAEQDIRSRGLDAASQQAQLIRANAAAIADANTQLEKSKDAWNTYKQAGESAIDTLFSGDKFGDIGKKLANTALDLGKQLIVTNPLKNMLLGTNYGTIGDLFSGKKSGGGILGGLGQSVASMNVNAASVMINGGLAGGLDLFGKSSDTTGSVTKLLTAANSNNAAAPGGSIASYITQAALKRNMDPAIALAVAKSEGGLSSWNMQSSVIKNGIREPSFGPYQLYMNGGLGNVFKSKTGLDPRIAANGPAGVDFALDHASKNGWGSWYGAGKAGIGNWDGIGKVNSSLTQLSGSVNSASTGVGSLTSASGAAANGLTSFGGGLDQFGNKLATTLSGAGSGGGGGGGGLFGWLGNLFGGGGGGFNIGSNATPITGFNPFAAYANAGFDSGGFTGEGGKYEPAGVVHKGEFVFDAAATARAGVSTLDRLHRTLKGYSDGGGVGRSVFSAPGPEPLQRSSAANSNAPGGTALTKMDVTLNVAGADSKDSEAAGYAGMRRALAEYDRALPDRVIGINKDPRWRT